MFASIVVEFIIAYISAKTHFRSHCRTILLRYQVRPHRSTFTRIYMLVYISRKYLRWTFSEFAPDVFWKWPVFSWFNKIIFLDFFKLNFLIVFSFSFRLFSCSYFVLLLFFCFRFLFLRVKTANMYDEHCCNFMPLYIKYPLPNLHSTTSKTL